MAALSTAQVGGIDNVVQLYANRGLKVWSIWVGKQFLFVGDDVDTLTETLTAIENGSNCLYTLKVYKEPTSDEINEKTPCAGSFNFYVREKAKVEGRYGPMDQDRAERGSKPAYKGKIGIVQERIEKHIADKIDELLDAGLNATGSDAPQGIGDILQDPEKVKEWISILSMIKGLVGPGNNGTAGAPVIPMQLASVAGMAEQTKEVAKDYSDADQERLIAALNTLGEQDKKIISHLEKLARIARDNKTMFATFVSMLESMP